MALALPAGQGAAETVMVPGTANPYLSGMPDGATASRGDRAPDHAPVLVLSKGIAPGFVLAFTVSGTVDNTGGGGDAGPDGERPIHHYPGDENGMSGVIAPLNALMAVFLGDGPPDPAATPDQLDFRETGTGFADLQPEIGQVFFIGDGRDDEGGTQSFWVPKQASRLYLGTMDGFGWYNNSGTFQVTIESRDGIAP